RIGGTGPELVRDIAIALPNSPAPTGTFQFSSASLSVDEDANSATVTVTRTGNTSGASSVDLTTVDDSAKQRSDYIIALRRLEFGPGETTKSVKILIVNDVFVDPSETFKVFLSNATGGFLPGSPEPLVVTIADNDFPTVQPIPNPLNDAEFFVRQQYFDFLNREPDTAGFNF
ncbi:MAG TPA: Calx-beta domain-containing protein, partial [Pyrinomonadaceae bacterium]|nr:Calx-beta domain-containing protein [Pyrinomonadaceae bacterium]